MVELIAMDYPFAPEFQLIVHCRQGAEWISQAPQGPLASLARRHRTLVVPGPKFHHEACRPYFTLSPARDYGDVMVMQTHFPAALLAEGALVDGECTSMLEKALIGPLIGEFPCAVHWFQDPMAAEAHAGRHQVVATVYECRDGQVDANVLPRAAARERRLLGLCDLVIARDETAAARSDAAVTLCVAPGEDYDQSGCVGLESGIPAVPIDLKTLGGPVLGYCGVIDERIDLQLVAELAGADPNWHVVMVGPIAGPDPVTLPSLPNLHWLGGRSHGELAAYAKAFQVGLMPFIQDEAAPAAQHRKLALQYFSSGTPVVATSGPGLVREFPGALHVAKSGEFVAMCRQQVTAPDHGAIQHGLEYARGHSQPAATQEIEVCLALLVASREGAGMSATGLDRFFNMIIAAGEA